MPECPLPVLLFLLRPLVPFFHLRFFGALLVFAEIMIGLLRRFLLAGGDLFAGVMFGVAIGIAGAFVMLAGEDEHSGKRAEEKDLFHGSTI